MPQALQDCRCRARSSPRSGPTPWLPRPRLPQLLRLRRLPVPLLALNLRRPEQQPLHRARRRPGLGLLAAALRQAGHGARLGRAGLAEHLRGSGARRLDIRRGVRCRAMEAMARRRGIGGVDQLRTDTASTLARRIHRMGRSVSVIKRGESVSIIRRARGGGGAGVAAGRDGAAAAASPVVASLPSMPSFLLYHNDAVRLFHSSVSCSRARRSICSGPNIAPRASIPPAWPALESCWRACISRL